jgi:hypothetical protein
MNRRGMDGWMGKGRERDVFYKVVFSNSLAGEKEKVGARRVCVFGRKKGERGKKREREKEEKKKEIRRARLWYG